MEKLMLALDVVPVGSSAVGRGLLSPYFNAASSVWVIVTGTATSSSSSAVSEVLPDKHLILTQSDVCTVSLENCLVDIRDEEVDDDDDDDADDEDDIESLAPRWYFMTVFVFPSSAQIL